MTTMPATATGTADNPAVVPRADGTVSLVDGGPLPFMAFMPCDDSIDERDVDGAILAFSRFAEGFRFQSTRHSIEIVPQLPIEIPSESTASPRLLRAATGPLSMRIRRDPLERTCLLVQIDDDLPGAGMLTLRGAGDLAHRIQSATDDDARTAITRTLLLGVVDMLRAMRLRRCMDARRIDAHARRAVCVLRSQDPASTGGPSLWQAPFLDMPSQATSYSRQGPAPFHVPEAMLAAKAVVDAECGRLFGVDRKAPHPQREGFSFSLEPSRHPTFRVDAHEIESTMRDIGTKVHQ